MTGVLEQRKQLKNGIFERTHICHICGHKITVYEIAASLIDAELIDWNIRATVPLSISICEECLLKILENIEKGSHD